MMPRIPPPPLEPRCKSNHRASVVIFVNCSVASDKHRGDDAEAAADRFKDIATAYSILRCGRAADIPRNALS